ncbi:MAG: DUF4402 domain-containing protein [Acidobacteria bacterium]|nr:DUF4402 domain-containing protein [Acidobacteriota bacterium]
MNKIVRSLPILTLALASAPVFAQSSATADIGARLLRPMTITKTADLEFGAIVVTEAAGVIQAGNVVLAPATNAETATASTALGTAGPIAAAPQAASFTVSGSGGKNYKLYVTAGSVTLKNASTAATITCGTFTASSTTGTVPATLPTGNPAATNAVMTAGTNRQSQTVKVGGTLSWATGLTDDGDYQASAVAGGSTFVVNAVYN